MATLHGATENPLLYTNPGTAVQSFGEGYLTAISESDCWHASDCSVWPSAAPWIAGPRSKAPAGHVGPVSALCCQHRRCGHRGNAEDSAQMVSTDGGTRWEEQLVPGSVSCVHMNLAVLTGGNLLALYRSRWADSIYASRSEGGGLSWSEPVPTELPNINSSIQFTALDDGRLALIYNHSTASTDTERRLSLYDEIDDESLDEAVDGPVAFEPVVGRDSDERKAFWGTP